MRFTAIVNRPARLIVMTAAAQCLALLVVSPGAPAAEPEDLSTHRALWQAAGVDAYEYAYNKYCDCHRETPPETFVTVQEDEVVGVRHRPFGFEHYVEAEPRNFEWYWTVDGLFGLIETALQRQAQVRADYDPALGYPTRIYIDYDSDLIGDELDLRLTRLDPLGG